MIAATRSRRFRDDILKSDLCVADGMPIIWMARALGVPLPERVSGSDLFDHLVAQHGRGALSVYFFGGEAGISSRAHEWVNAQGGGLVSSGHLDPGFGSTEILSEPGLLEAINREAPDFLILSLGAEKGQAWIERNLNRLNAPVISHLGAVVKFAAGTVRRAPRIMRIAGLEWLWRMKEEPFLWRRYAGDAWGLANLMLGRSLRQLLTRPLGKGSGRPTEVRLVHRQGFSALRLQGVWRGGELEALRDALQQVGERRCSVVLDLSRVDEIDSATIGLLLLLRGHCLRLGLGMRIVAASAAAQRALHFYCADYLLETLESVTTTPIEDPDPAVTRPAVPTATPAMARASRDAARAAIDGRLPARAEQAPHP